MRFKPVLLHIVTPLLVGGMLYIAFRSNKLIMFKWFEVMNLSDCTNQIRDLLNPLIHYMPKWVFNSLPDGLWVYAYSSSYMLYFRGRAWKDNYWLFFPFLFGSVAELAQSMKIIAGTFDYLDLIFCLLGSIVSITLNLKNEKQICKDDRSNPNFSFFYSDGVRLRKFKKQI